MFKRITELGDDHREVRRPTPLAEIAAVAGASPAEVEACISHFAEPGRSFVTVSATAWWTSRTRASSGSGRG